MRQVRETAIEELAAQSRQEARRLVAHEPDSRLLPLAAQLRRSRASRTRREQQEKEVMMQVRTSDS